LPWLQIERFGKSHEGGRVRHRKGASAEQRDLRSRHARDYGKVGERPSVLDAGVFDYP
jgi:hypothetical protein